MILTEIAAINYRNYDKFKLELSPRINIIYGNNGNGKTNILECIYYLGITKSHRVSNDSYLIKQNMDFTKIKGSVLLEKITTILEIELNKNKKTLKKDKIETKANNYLSNLNVIIFYPDDLSLIKGNPMERRRFLNIEISQINNSYLHYFSEYNKLLKIRNDLLKKTNIEKDYFNIITEKLIEKGIIIYKFRKKFIKQLNNYSANIFADISGLENFSLKYISNVTFDCSEEDTEKLKMQYLNQLKSSYNREIKYGNTLIGPHRDDFLFDLNNNDLKKYGSQGQQRMAILTIKLAEVKIYQEIYHKKPILLLDDVFSELDDLKKNNLLKYINGNIQTLITTTDLTNLNEDIIKKAKIFYVQDGNIIEKEKV